MREIRAVAQRSRCSKSYNSFAQGTTLPKLSCKQLWNVLKILIITATEQHVDLLKFRQGRFLQNQRINFLKVILAIIQYQIIIYYHINIKKLMNLRFFCFVITLVHIHCISSSVEKHEDIQNYSLIQEKQNIQNLTNHQQNDPKLCDRNRFQFASIYALGRQNDLNQTFEQLKNKTNIPQISYKDQPYRTYTIKNFKVNYSFIQSSQKVQITQINTVRVSGGTVKIQYTFDWQKKQLGQVVPGNGGGSVRTEPILFEKTLDTTADHILVWTLARADPVKITNSLTLSNIFPFKKADFDVITQMLNSLKNNHTTVKDQLIAAINATYKQILAKKVKNDSAWTIDRVIDYSYLDYRGLFTVSYDNLLQHTNLANQGLSMEISQTIQNYPQFQCGKIVPNTPDDRSIFGGSQQLISNSLLKSTLLYAINKGSLDVILTEQFWQSRAFQFYIADMQEVIPTTKNFSLYQKISGRCNALNDKNFKFQKKSQTTYQVTVNFACDFVFLKNTPLLGIDILVTYEVKPKLYEKYLDFSISKISGLTTFREQPNFKIVDKDLALFMIDETLKTALNTKVVGSGYKTSTRKYPNIAVRNDYLVLYDSSVR